MTKPDFASAAARHLRDAEHLASEGPHRSPDQAWHLVGYVLECSRKACVASGWIPKLLGHDFTDGSEVVVEVAIALDPRASRMPVRGWNARYPEVGAWRPDHRYDRTGTLEATPARDLTSLLGVARAAVDDVTVALLLEGEVAMELLAR